MFAVRLSLKILTACSIQAQIKSAQNQWTLICDRMFGGAQGRALKFSRQPLCTLCYEGLYAILFIIIVLFSSILPKFNVYISFLEDSLSALLRDFVTVYARFQVCFGSEKLFKIFAFILSAVGVAHLKII